MEDDRANIVDGARNAPDNIERVQGLLGLCGCGVLKHVRVEVRVQLRCDHILVELVEEWKERLHRTTCTLQYYIPSHAAAEAPFACVTALILRPAQLLLYCNL